MQIYVAQMHINVLSSLFLYCSRQKLQYNSNCDTSFILLLRRFAIEIGEQVNS